MTKKKISVSVIVPVFNTSVYLHRCLDSILCQSEAQIEVLCVDDGSTDGSLAILEEYARHDERLCVIQHSEGAGRGPGAARNHAMRQASGEFVAFVDSDDYIHHEMLRELYLRATECDADVSICTIKKFSDITTKESYGRCSFDKLIPLELDDRTFSWKDIENRLFELRFCVWNKLYRRSFLEKEAVAFSEGIFWEDLVFSFKAILRAERLCLVRRPLYYNRRQRKGAITFSQSAGTRGAIEAMAQLEALLRSRSEYSGMLTRFEAFRFVKLYEYLHRSDGQSLPGYYAKLRRYAGSMSTESLGYLSQSMALKRDAVVKYDLVDFLAGELWEERNRSASLRRMLRKTKAKKLQLRRRLIRE